MVQRANEHSRLKELSNTVSHMGLGWGWDVPGRGGLRRFFKTVGSWLLVQPGCLPQLLHAVPTWQ